MNAIFEKYKWLRVVLGALVIAFGIAVIIIALAAPGEVGKVINIVVAVSLFIFGAFLLVTSLLAETHKPITSALLMSALIITTGVLVLLMRFTFHINLTGLLVYLITVFLVVFGSIALAKAVFLIVYKQKVIFIVLMFILAALGIASGLVGLCFAGNLVDASYILLGVFMIAIGTVVIAIPTIKKK